MNEKPSTWTPEEKITLFAAVEQCRATGGQLDWRAIAATVPGRGPYAAEVQYYQLQPNEKPSAWTPEEKIALVAAVEQCRATSGQLDWDAIAATVPGRGPYAAEVQYYQLQPNEKPSAWTPEEKIALVAAVEQCRATSGQLDWDAIAATVPGRSPYAAEVQYYQLQPVRTPVPIRAPAVPVSPPPSVLRRPCLRCRRPFESLDRKRNWICSSCHGHIAALGSVAA